MDNKVVLRAIFSKATTLIDGGWRVSLDLPESAPIDALTALRGEDLVVVVMPYSDALPEDC